MEDSFGKYLRLFGSIFFVVIGFITVLILAMLGLKFFFGLLSYIPWFTYFYMSLIIMVPAAIFVTAYIVFFRRTANHPVRWVRRLSRVIFLLALISWMVFFITDLRSFFKHFYTSIEQYYSYNLLFLAINIGVIFFTGVLQALTTEKEKDWMERRRQ